MIKKLDTLIVKAFIGPFLATFLISLFVLVMQFFWLYIDDLVGKGLGFFTIIKLIGYVAASTVPMALPLALLLSSIMTFGNLGESFELVAIKSAGIPLTRFMRPLFIVTIFISGIAFFFSNNIIPVINLKLNALKYDIIVTKPAFDIKEGTFYDKIDGFVIKIGKKEADDSTIRNVVIYEKNMGLQDRIMVAQSGVMSVTPDKRFLQFNLYNGWRYEENGSQGASNTEFIRLGFKSYRKIFDLSSFKMSKTEDTLFKYDPKMLTIGQLNTAIKSMSNVTTESYKMMQRDIVPSIPFMRYADSAWPLVQKASIKSVSNFDVIIPDSLRENINDLALNRVGNNDNNIESGVKDYEQRSLQLRKHWMEWNKKFTLSAACLVLFLIGAPLGSIIRKGGLGAPLVFAVIFFVAYYMLDTIGSKIAKEGVVAVGFGMWMSTIVLTPIGIFLVMKAMRDSQLFNKEFYFRVFRTVKLLFKA